ncbi:MAG TPA: Gfo/Idh/MocA family oxidoreductase [Planctomycetota bacterium]|nr:Gfo/Idh/MocA family oxidoreductase [Planctomycetota bacterium]
MARDRVNVAVVGLGMGRHHLKGYYDYPRSRAVAICDVDAARLAQFAAECKIPPENCFTDYRKLMASARKLELDAVSVALPNALHAPVTIAGLNAGLHVLCEKPMAMNVRQARAMLAAAKKARRKLMINFSYRFMPQTQSLKSVVASGAIGEVYYGRTAWYRRRGLPGFGGWFGQKKLSGGGPVIDLGVHRIDMAMWLMGSPKPVSVSASTYSVIGARVAKEQRKTFDVEDIGGAFIRFDNGATLLAEASWAGFTQKREEMITQLLGTKGGILHSNVNETYEFEARVFTEHDGALWETKLQQGLAPCPTAYQEFVNAIIEGRETIAPGEHGFAVQQILDAIYQSAATGREVRIKA